MTLPYINTFAPTDENFRQCRCGAPKNEHYSQAYYADAEDDPSTELLRALEELAVHAAHSEKLGCDISNCQWMRARAAISHAQTAIDNARVLSCRKGWDAIQAAIMPEMQFEEARRDE